jgi:hypothetical protein
VNKVWSKTIENEEETMFKSREDHIASSALTDPRHVDASHRNLLLGGTAIVAAAAVGSVLSPRKTNAQQQQPASSGKPANILDSGTGSQAVKQRLGQPERVDAYQQVPVL